MKGSTVYSVQPLFDGSNSHAGFIFVAGLSIALVLWAAYHTLSGSFASKARFTWVLVGGLALTAWTYQGSFVDYKPPLNKVVTAKFEGYVAEQIVEKSGKFCSPAHRVYGAFIVPEGRVLLAVPADKPISPQVILYKN